MQRQTTWLRAQRSLPGTPIGLVCTIALNAAVAPDLPTYCRWRPSETLGDPPDRPARRDATRNLFAFLKPYFSAAKALRRGAGAIPPWSTTIRSTPVLFLLSSAREMAAALCPFFHRSQSSAFCAAVNHIRACNPIAHLPIPQD